MSGDVLADQRPLGGGHPTEPKVLLAGRAGAGPAELAGAGGDGDAALAALHHAVSYRSIVAGMTPPVEPHMSRSTAWWLRQVLADLSDVSPGPEPGTRCSSPRPRRPVA